MQNQSSNECGVCGGKGEVWTRTALPHITDKLIPCQECVEPKLSHEQELALFPVEEGSRGVF